MPYVIETWDKPGSQTVRAEHRPAHLAFLATHAAKLLACGAKLHDDGSDMGGGIYVLDTEDRNEAEAFIAADAVADFSRADHDQALHWIARTSGVPMTTDQLLEVL